MGSGKFYPVESTCCHLAGGANWIFPTKENPQWSLRMKRTGTSGSIRFVNELGESFLVVLGVRNYRPWFDIVTDLKPDDTAMKIHPSYYNGGERSGIPLKQYKVEKVNSKNRRFSLRVTGQDRDHFVCSLVVQNA
ncbi:Cytolysin/lectin [Crucibulum laeve]|uniref:Cytolysin/lectin n=1 Tax=Crucibulum laeve TaxID=68775 RepID=A0A5C3LKI4_9AGAR|nr:Cytolysin/lectin [Crucibulum laeve]